VSELDDGAGDDPNPASQADHAFDRLVSATDPVMLVVTAAVGGRRDGCLVGFHAQCGIEPRRYALWMSKANGTTDLVTDERCTHVGVHLLRADQHPLARRFGTLTGDDVDKLAGLPWTEGPGGSVRLSDCPDHWVGRKVDLVDVDADHLCLVVEPVEVSRDRDPSSARWLRLGQVADLVAGHAPDDHS
jgi:flavin reductase (DIM6/NTAB) family NADH-FMN oxidoreductase RutF